MNFNDIWSKLSWIIEEMKDGMCFFEGYIPSIFQSDLLSPLSEIAERAKSYNLKYSVWSNDSNESDWEKEFSLPQYLEFFNLKKIVLLHFDYEMQIGSFLLLQKLIFEKSENNTTLEIICYREPIINSVNPKEALEAELTELGDLKRRFGGNALFIGPDTLNYPKNEFEYSKEWLKIA